MKIKNYTQAPLPFQGQKRRFLKDLNLVLKNFPSDAVFIDLFGGSGLLSHTVKQFYPNSEVIYNDFDNYKKRVENISVTNKILKEIRAITSDLPKEKKITNECKVSILEVVKDYEEKGFVDYITLSSSLLFSANYVTNFQDLKKATFYNVVKQNDYNADDYLQGVKTVCLDYKDLYSQYKDVKNIVWLVDPPYLSTDSSSYNSNGYWKLKDYLDVLKVIDKHPYIYFTSNKSSIVELCEWIETKIPGANPFAGSYLRTIDVKMNYNSSYTDMMYYKYSNNT